MKRLALFCLLLIAASCRSQPGCMDPQAGNYNAAATWNDGSCVYNTTNYTLLPKDTLPGLLLEISGMQVWNGKLYAHGDSGNPPVLYELDTLSGLITKEIYLQGVVNTDWEDMSQDDDHFYIADIGNNAGDRTDLKVFRFKKSLLTAAYYDTIDLNQVEQILFNYPDQLNFNPAINATAYDCEAIAWKDEKLHLFTKNWTGGACVHYTIPDSAGIYAAQRVDSLDTQGILVTGADFGGKSQLMLPGYKASGFADVAMWYVYDYANNDSFFISGNKRRIDLGTAALLGQVEGICFVDSSYGFVSNERFNPIAAIDIPQQLYRFGTANWFPYHVASGVMNTGQFAFLPEVRCGKREIEVKLAQPLNAMLGLVLYDNHGRKIREKAFNPGGGIQRFALENLDIPAGMYYLLIHYGDGLKKLQKVFFQNR